MKLFENLEDMGGSIQAVIQQMVEELFNTEIDEDVVEEIANRLSLSELLALDTAYTNGNKDEVKNILGDEVQLEYSMGMGRQVTSSASDRPTPSRRDTSANAKQAGHDDHGNGSYSGGVQSGVTTQNVKSNGSDEVENPDAVMADGEEQLDELSPKTIQSYQKKADLDYSKAAEDERYHQHADRQADRRGSEKASAHHKDLAKKAGQRADRREKGADMANVAYYRGFAESGTFDPDYYPEQDFDKVVKNRLDHATQIRANQKKREEERKEQEDGQIDELSRDTLRSYMAKADMQGDDLSKRAERHAASGEDETKPSDLRWAHDDEANVLRLKSNRRRYGVDQAVGKMESEQLDELSPKTLGSYVKKSKSDRDIKTGLGDYFAGQGRRKERDLDTEKGLNTPKAKQAKRSRDMYHADRDTVRGKAAKRTAGMKVARRKMRKEDAQIDELSGATLGSYVVKSKDDEGKRRERGTKVRDQLRKQTGMKNLGGPMDRKLHSPTVSRKAGQKRALDKLTGKARVNAKEEVQVDELSKKTLGSYVKKSTKDGLETATRYGVTKNPDLEKRLLKRIDKRRSGVDQAVDHLTKEEQVNELSRDTLKSYKAKAQDKRDDHWSDLNNLYNNPAQTSQQQDDDRHDRGVFRKEIGKRSIGINRATKRLAKEEVEGTNEVRVRSTNEIVSSTPTSLGSEWMDGGERAHYAKQMQREHKVKVIYRGTNDDPKISFSGEQKNVEAAVVSFYGNRLRQAHRDNEHLFGDDNVISGKSISMDDIMKRKSFTQRNEQQIDEISWNTSLTSGASFDDTVKFLRFDWKAWRVHPANKIYTVVGDGDLRLVYLENKHIASYHIMKQELYTDDSSIFGNETTSEATEHPVHSLTVSPDAMRGVDKKAGRRKAGSWGRPGSAKQKRAANKAVRSSAKKELTKEDADFVKVSGRREYDKIMDQLDADYNSMNQSMLVDGEMVGYTQEIDRDEDNIWLAYYVKPEYAQMTEEDDGTEDEWAHYLDLAKFINAYEYSDSQGAIFGDFGLSDNDIATDFSELGIWTEEAAIKWLGHYMRAVGDDGTSYIPEDESQYAGTAAVEFARVGHKELVALAQEYQATMAGQGLGRDEHEIMADMEYIAAAFDYDVESYLEGPVNEAKDGNVVKMVEWLKRRAGI